MVLKQFELFKNIPTIETERLRLRKIQPSDAENVYEYASRPLVSEFLLWYPHENLDYTRNYLARIKKEYARKIMENPSFKAFLEKYEATATMEYMKTADGYQVRLQF